MMLRRAVLSGRHIRSEGVRGSVEAFVRARAAVDNSLLSGGSFSPHSEVVISSKPEVADHQREVAISTFETVSEHCQLSTASSARLFLRSQPHCVSMRMTIMTKLSVMSQMLLVLLQISEE